METDARKKILVVEDEKEWRGQVSTSLLEAGYEVLPAGDASEAMQQAEDPRLGLMVVGEDLGGESGRMLTRFLRRNHPNVPILLCMNQKCDDAEVRQLMEQGVDQCVTKGSLEELIVTVGYCTR